MLQLHSNFVINRRNQPFRFQAMWLSHADFSNFVADNWNSSSGNFLNKTLSLAPSLKQWNMTVFGNIFHKTQILLARIGGIQKCSDLHENRFLMQLEATLIKEYETIKDQENLFWRQKSKDKWLHDGDKNTKYFHLTTLVRRKRNKIECLFDSHGHWYDDSTNMMNIAVNFFSNLFSHNSLEDSMFNIPRFFPRMEPADIEKICAPVSMLEVKKCDVQHWRP
ncbi:hypothetical protein M0R45_026609 [Rubus argutus]|uniref:Transposon TX1 n=1 Tax=Rubus argutus TaxID=59490 RepID=A0AAW1WY12_RUBAR